MYKKAALKAIQKMPRPQSQKLQIELEAMAQDPYAYQGDWKPLKGEPYWRLRQGSYRAICRIDHGELMLFSLRPLLTSRPRRRQASLVYVE